MTVINPMWIPVPTDLTLLPDDVHVWRIDLDLPESRLEELRQTLCDDEITRADRFYQKLHRHRFIAGRGILRSILANYLGIEPSQVQFEYEPLGKPVLAEAHGDNRPCFNLSHSQGLGLCAVSCDRPLGVDLEYIRPMSDLLSLAKQFFAPSEYDLIQSLPPQQKKEIFFRYWTCKEAYLKATGVGLSKLREIEITLSPRDSAQLKNISDWNLVEIKPGDNFAAAVAINGFGWEIKYWQYSQLIVDS
ncbi:MAG: 4'-phosphopantetheinyl transferase superfamily protein [Calothrix sp. MO_192.B10]|nr:4'-phosphopantetheinyl transferase superfamily protein [Calothrix sp. MO_192.B10]